MLHRISAGAIVVFWVIALARPSATAQDNPQSIDPATQRPQVEIDLDAEVAAARKVDVASTDVDARSLASLVQTARKCERFDRREDATDLYHLSATVCESLLSRNDGGIAVAQSVAILATAASALTSQGRHADAERWLTLALAQGPTEAMAARLGQTWLSVASGFLDDGELSQSRDAYRSATETLARSGAADPKSLATARLGLAWTMVMLVGTVEDASAGTATANVEATRQALAATESFLQHHPDHADASSAWLLKLSCQKRLQDTDGASQTRSVIFKRFPHSIAACEVLKSSCHWQNEHNAVDQSLREYLILNQPFVIESPLVGTNIHILATGLLAAAVEGHAAAETGYALTLSITDEVGDASTYVLEHLHAAGHDAAASRIAIGWISARDAAGHQSELARMQQQADRLITVGVREAACRWAGRTGRWSVLAMAAEEEKTLFAVANKIPADEATIDEAERRGLSLHVKRLFAEGLLQTGKTKQSLKVWEHIVDQEGADDFPTLLRTAETAVAAGSVSQATLRIAAAQGAAQHPPESPSPSHLSTGDSGRLALTNLLAANLEIRQLRFDRGRARLEQVVRSAEATDDLRGRAQWMIGETFFMQQNFSEAIAAYRQVEPIGRSDEWTAAALVQAGKSFEQLGRTREATVCYSTLVSRFGESPHAGGARRRLAAMTTTDSESNTIRR